MNIKSTDKLCLPFEEKSLFSCIDELAQKNNVNRETIIISAWTKLISKHSLDDSIFVDYFKDAENCVEFNLLVMDDITSNILVSEVNKNIKDTSLYVKVKKYSLAESSYKKCLIAKVTSNKSISLEEFLNVDIFLLFSIEYNKVNYEILYNSDLYEEDCINCLGMHLYNFLFAWNKNNDKYLSDVEYLSKIEKNRIYEESVGVSKDLSYNQDIYSRFIQQTQMSKNKTAIIEYHSKTNYTYEQVHKRVLILSQKLRDLGINENSIVGVYLERSLDVIVSLLSILKLGAIYVPLDRSYPKDYLNAIIEDCNLNLIIAKEEIYMETSVLNLNNIDFYADILFDEEIILDRDTSKLSFIFYTSGSTGKPKGVMQTQKQLINRLHWMWQEYPFEKDDVMGQRASLNTIPSLWDIFGGLLAGVPTVIVPDDIVKDSAKLLECLYNEKITFITLTPSILRLLSLEEEKEKVRYLRIVLTLGEKLTQKVYNTIRNTFLNTVIVNDYGSTETHTNLHGKYDGSVKNIDEIGLKQIVNVQAFILDNKNHIMDYGEIGELCIAGPNIAQGYLNSPKINSEKFINWQFDKEKPLIRIFKTGDLAYRKKGEGIFLIGRRDHVLKVNGKRIDKDGVENVLLSFPSIDEGVVIGNKLSSGKIMLQAFVTLKNNTYKTEICSEIEKHLKKYLPEYMVPKQIKILDNMPNTPSGKVDYKALERMFLEDDLQKQHFNRNSISEKIASILAEVLEAESNTLDFNREFAVMGIDSVLVMEFVIKLKNEFKIKISPSDIFDYPNVNRLSTYIEEVVLNRNCKKEVKKGNCENINDIAVIGMSGQFPGAENVEQLWGNLKAGVCSISEIPKDRWNIDGFYDSNPAKAEYSYSKWGGFLSGIDKFDARFFNLSSKEAIYMDPQQRLCLMESYKAIENAGYNPLDNKLTDVGVFVGASVFDYEKLVSRDSEPCAERTLGNEISMIASRISYFNNFTGPSMVVDTACSSSLTAFHLACQSIKSGDCKMALVGGIAIVNDPNFYINTSKLNVFSKSGLCKTFDNEADGFVNGEGVVFVVLKSLKDAEEDKDNILAVVKGSVINQDGRSNGITAPSSESQSELERKLYNKYNISPKTIGYVETHGTGTRLGDLIEIKSLMKVFLEYSNESKSCAIGSIKTNIGHLTAAAGLAGVIKVILCLSNKQLVPSINLKNLNSLIEWKDSPLYVNTEFKEWEHNENTPRRAAVSSFGIGGTNVHCVLEEYQGGQQKDFNEVNKKFIIPVSAKSDFSLKTKLIELRKWIEKNKFNYRISDLSYVCITGREMFEKGYIITASSFKDLDNKILDILNNKENDDVSMITQGLQWNLEELFNGIETRRIPVPVYPFDLRSYYVKKKEFVNEQVKSDIDNILKDKDTYDVEDTLKVIIANALGEDKNTVDINKPLEEMGIDSLKAINLKQKIALILKIELPLSKLLNGNTIKTIVDSMDLKKEGKKIRYERSLTEKNTEIQNDMNKVFDLTEMQESYYFGRNKFNIDAVGCHTYVEFSVENLSEDRLEKAWNILLQHHPMLRAIMLKNGKQRIEDYTYYKFKINNVEDEDKDNHLQRVRDELSHKIYKAEESPLYTIIISKFKSNVSIVHFSIDSWIVDGKSADIIFNQWKELYYNFDFPLKVLKVNFSQYIKAIKEAKDSEEYSQKLKYWINKLSGKNLAAHLPVNKENKIERGSFYKRTNYEYSLKNKELWTKVKNYFIDKKISATAVMLTIFNDVLAKFNEGDEFAVIITTMNRYLAEDDIQEVVGPFTSSSIFIVDCTDKNSLENKINKTQKQLYDDIDNNIVSGISAIRNLEGLSTDEKAIPIVFTSTVNNKKYKVSFNDDIIYSISQTPNIYIECRVSEEKENLVVKWTVAEDYFAKGFIKKAFELYCTSIEEYVNKLFSPKEEEKLLVEKNKYDSIKLTSLQASYLYYRVTKKDNKSGLIYKDFIVEDIDTDRLESVVDLLINTHESLRYSINLNSQSLNLEEFVTFKIKVKDFSNLNNYEKDKAFEIYKEEFKDGFINGANAPRFDIAIVRMDNHMSYLIICLDMVVFDAPASYLFIDRLFKLYENKEEQMIRKYSYSDYIAYKEDNASFDDSYWKEKFIQQENGPRWEKVISDEKSEFIVFNAEFNIYENLLKRAEELGVDPISIFIAVYGKVLSKWALESKLSVLAINYENRKLNKDFEYSFGDYTSLCWIGNSRCLNMSFKESVKMIDKIFKEDLKHNTCDPLSKLILENKNGAENKSFNAVITNCLDSHTSFLDRHKINESYSNTPGVVIDNVIYKTNHGIAFEWQVLKNVIDKDMALSMFKDYRYIIKELALNGGTWEEMYNSESLFNDIKTRNYYNNNGNKLSKEDYEKIVYTWNSTECKYNDSILLQELIEEKARINGEAPAVITDNCILTYKKLNEEANKLAEYILNNEDLSDSPIGIFVERSEKMIISIIAVLKAGRAYLPFNMDDPIDRIKSIIEDSKTDLIITSSTCKDKLKNLDVKLLIPDKLNLENIVNRNIRKQDADSKDLAYIIFTSGSTGKPKGVAVNHRAVVNLIEWSQKEFNFSSNDRVLFVNPINFDLSVFDIFGILASGGSIRLVSDGNRYNPFYLIDVINNENITFWNSAPAYLKMIMQAFAHKKITNPSIRLFFLSGDWIPVSMPEKIKETFKEAEFVSLGGATEATVWSNYYVVNGRSEDYPSIPYGKPIQNSQYYILDENLQPCAVNESGELYIAGECLSQGYYNNEKLTKERYINNPFVEGNKCMYKTGDKAKFHADGNIEFIGRIDNQVKIRGYRVELGEVEAALRECGLQEAVVVARGESMDNKKLVGFIKSKEMLGKVSDEKVWEEINSKVSKYMIPSEIYALSEIPITSNGKVDRKKLMNSSIDNLLNDEKGFDKRINREIKIAISEITSQDISKIKDDSNLGDLGLNSLQYTLLSINLADKFNFELNPALFFKYNTVAEIADFLMNEYKEEIIKSLPKEKVQAEPEKVVEAKNIQDDEEIKYEEDGVAIIGVKAIMPDAPDIEAFWRNLSNGINSVKVIPKERWDWKEVYGNPADKENVTDVKYGYFINDIKSFDPLFFGISPREAELMDPRQRLLMENIWHLLEGAGYNPKALRGSDTAIFIGATGDEYLTISSKVNKPIDEFTLMGTSRTVLPNRVSYYYDWHGPSEVVDTACSSSLVAIHRAVQAIKTGESKMAVAAGINLIMEPRPHISLDKVGMLAKDGKCKTFDESANGYGRGEGIGVILLKSLKDAKIDHDNIIAVIRGSAINHGGKANALTAPNPKAQTALIKQAIKNANINIAQIGYVETHGTGTALGDPIEIEGIKDAIKPFYEKNSLDYSKKRIALGSVKSNIGHLESAAGIAGALKLILALKNKVIPASVNINKINEKIDIKDTPLYIALEKEDWKIPYDNCGKKLLRAGGVSAFGFGGVNAHVIIEEYNDDNNKNSRTNKGNYIIPLSAQNEETLKNIAEQLLDFISERKKYNVADIAYTLQIGRQAFDKRVAIVTDSLEDLIEKLKKFIDCIDDRYIYKNYEKTSEKLQKYFHDKDFQEDGIFQKFNIDEIADIWSLGGFDRWESLWIEKNEKPYRIELPCYPFNNKDYWLVDDEKTHKEKLLEGKLIEEKDDYKLAAKFKITGKEKFLTDHIINGTKLIPGALYFEYIKAVTKTKFPIYMKDVMWLNTISEEQIPAEIQIFSKQENDYKTISFRYGDNTETCTARVKMRRNSPEKVKKFNINEIKSKFTKIVDQKNIYRKFKENKIDYGSYFRVLDKIWIGEKESFAYLETKDSKVGFNPKVIDGAFQTVVFNNLEKSDSKSTFIPFSIEEINAYEKLPNKCYVYVSKDNVNRVSSISKYTIYIMNIDGKTIVEIKGYLGRSIKNHDDRKTNISKNVSLYKEQFQYLTTISEVEFREKNDYNVLINFHEKQEPSLKNAIFIEPIDGNYERVSKNSFKFNIENEDSWKLFYDDTKSFKVSKFIYNADNRVRKSYINEYKFMHSMSKMLIKNIVNEKVKIIIVTKYSKGFSNSLISFGKTIEKENPKLKFKHLCLWGKDKEKISLSNIIGFCNEVNSMKEGHEFIINLDNYKCYIKKIVPYKYKDGYEKLIISKMSPYLITGGAGKIGLKIAKEISKRGGIAILLGRSNLTEEKLSKISSIKNTYYYKCNVADYKNLERVISEVEERFGRIKGVFHCAGVVKDKMFIKKSEEEALEVIKPKVEGANNLDKIFNKNELEFFILFSSLTSISGNIGQCDYAYANGFLDSFAKSSKGKTISFNWPLFKDGGMTINDTELNYIKQNIGMEAISDKDFIEILFNCIPKNTKEILVLSGEEQKLFSYINESI